MQRVSWCENASHVSVVESSLANEQPAIVVLIDRKLCDIDNISTRLELLPTHVTNPFLRSIIHGVTVYCIIMIVTFLWHFRVLLCHLLISIHPNSMYMWPMSSTVSSRLKVHKNFTKLQVMPNVIIDCMCR